MAEREHFVCGLVEEVLGPRGGHRETLPLIADPRDEYITGVLAPESAADDRNPEADSELLETSETGEEDAGGNGDAPSPQFSPSLDPRVLPKSFGISFLVQRLGGTPRIDVCLTWARYSQAGNVWQREPAHHVIQRVDASAKGVWDIPGDVRLVLRPRRQGRDKNTYHASLFFINTRRLGSDNRYSTGDLIFQPQIRVVCEESTTLVSLEKVRPEIANPEGEEAELALVYRDFSPLARGHLCGAVWKEIDPERTPPDRVRRTRAPFFWIDSESIPVDVRQRFSSPDLRTDFTPIIPVSSPSMQWTGNAGPVLDPEILAEVWNADRLRAALTPLATAYASWVQGLSERTQTLGRHRETGRLQVAKCQLVADRIRGGIDLVCTNEDARLAFCFVNKAMAMQARWGGRRSLDWYPFQLAFLLINIPGIIDKNHADRAICDLLWMPTGGGKTEAYLAVAVFSLALRRLTAEPDNCGERSGVGTGVVSRYTLRLLTVQQFRRALRAITACEVLRVHDLASHRAGWRPEECEIDRAYLWGTSRFSIGLWVGGGVTPNTLEGFTAPDPQRRFLRFMGGLEILWGATQGYRNWNADLDRLLGRGTQLIGSSEPAQIMNCPCCNSFTAIPNKGLPAGRHTLHFVVERAPRTINGDLSCQGKITVANVTRTAHQDRYETLSIEIDALASLPPGEIDRWWHEIALAGPLNGTRLCAVRPSRMGYFFRTYSNQRQNVKPYDFELYCPNPKCELNVDVCWHEKVPIPDDADQEGREGTWFPQSVLPQFRQAGWHQTSRSIPIPAYTVDDQIYQRCPSMVVATADKLARLAFDPDGSAIFGNVEFYHARWGYYRQWAPSSDGAPPQQSRQHPPLKARLTLRVPVRPIPPPDLIIQDELHLIEGPLGSMVGLYESAVDILCQDSNVKYIASSATVRHAEAQIRSLFNRSTAMFPPPGLDFGDNFFSRTPFHHPLESSGAGRLYIGICCPGRGSQTPIIRSWSSVLSTAHARRSAGALDAELDPYWTLVAYFNAIRELAGAAALYRQDIPQRIGPAGRQLREELLELSSRMDSTTLPMALERLSIELPSVESEDVILSTSMFGTGVDVARLGLMFVNGQPKTTSSYIQATGRVGRTQGGLVITFLKASRPRDLDHYEFFTGYHRALYRFVEPITVAPFSPRCRDRALGPLSVLLLRQAREISRSPVHLEWRIEQRLANQIFDCRARRMSAERHSREVESMVDALERRAQSQPEARRPAAGNVAEHVGAELDRWQQVAAGAATGNDLVYHEPSMLRPPARRVVLGDDPHQLADLTVVFRNAPQSLRDVEPTTTLET